MIWKKKRLIIFILTALLISLFVAIFLFKPSKINKYRVEKKRLVHSVYASGYIDSFDSVLIKSTVSGYVEKIFVKENEEIRKGQLLAVISNDTIKENLKEVDFQIASIKEKLSPNSDYRRELLNSIDIKRSFLENVEKTFDRRKLLYEKGLISKENFEEVKKEYEIAKKDYERQVNIYNDSIQSLNYQVDILEAKKKAIEEEMNKYYVRSPINGKVLRRFVNEGDYVNNLQQNNYLFSVGNEKNIETVLLVDEEYIPKVREGMKVLITIDSYPDDIFEGKIKLIETQSDRSSRTVKVKADVNYNKPVLFNLTVESNIIIKEFEALVIPDSAYRNGYVEIIDGRKTKKVAVSVSKERYNGYLAVDSGLKEGQEVLIK